MPALPSALYLMVWLGAVQQNLNQQRKYASRYAQALSRCTSQNAEAIPLRVLKGIKSPDKPPAERGGCKLTCSQEL